MPPVMVSAVPVLTEGMGLHSPLLLRGVWQSTKSNVLVTLLMAQKAALFEGGFCCLVFGPIYSAVPVYTWALSTLME
jgi:hypothetical protein